MGQAGRLSEMDKARGHRGDVSIPIERSGKSGEWRSYPNAKSDVSSIVGTSLSPLWFIDIMFSEYLHAAMRHAKYEIVEDDESFYGHIEAFPGAWANEKTLEACREEL